ncbi:MAG: DUF1499 domain-containing protein [Rhodospirillales bacterium]|nr:DUF1499 domain-containing protein [Rhodospirillales bacterium]
MTLVLGALAIIGAGVVGIRLWLGRAAELQVQPSEIVEFRALGPAARHNRFVMCPAEVCANVADAQSPVFEMSWERLRDYWNEAIAMQPRLELVAADPDGRKLTYIQRSLFFRFPDIITVEFMPVGESRSTLAIASHSRYGFSDFGVNEDRVETWASLLVQMMRKEQVSFAR